MSGWMWLALWCLGSARGEAVLVVKTDRPVVVVVNMRPYTAEGGEVVVTLEDGREGSQNVRIRNLLGQQQWAGRVDVPAAHRVTLSWELQHMNEGEPEPFEREEDQASMSDQGYGIVDGQLVKLKPGDDASTGRSPAPRPAPEPVVPRAPSEDPFLSVVEQVADQASPKPDPAVGTEATDGGPDASGTSEDTTPLPPGMGEVHFRNRNTTWTNVYVGEELHELRQDQEFRLQLAAGDHPVRIGDFRDKETWWTGQVRVEAGQRLELQFSRASAPRVMDHPDAWVEVSP